jgi:hypothetical protein
MSELSDSLADIIKKRTTSAVFGTYVFFWASFHWQGIYATLFTSEDLIHEKFGLMKNEYINQYFFGWHGWSSLWGYLIPFILTLLFIWPIPQVALIHIYRLEQRHKVARRRVKIEEEESLQVEKESLAKQTKKTLVAELAVEDKKQEAAKKDPKILWRQEFNNFKKTNDYSSFSEILRAVYTHGGDTYVSGMYSGSSPIFQLNPQALKMADVKGLITISSSGSKVKLTEKGKFFASLYDKSF